MSLSYCSPRELRPPTAYKKTLHKGRTEPLQKTLLMQILASAIHQLASSLASRVAKPDKGAILPADTLAAVDQQDALNPDIITNRSAINCPISVGRIMRRRPSVRMPRPGLRLWVPRTPQYRMRPILFRGIRIAGRLVDVE